ncbi:unnamed protein product [Pocillopora meandrina]|uniref:Regulatory protein zeste n=1 Tax=Pocillopora meandrina TaxID=46732 RepID=A0AAU9X1E3_9CNID|nr:unnamed protein product [Pocillopora meandrina]
MEWTHDHDILLLREMIASELFQFKKGSPDRGKIWESIQERLNKLDNPKFMIKEKRGVRDRWNLLQAKFKRMQREELQACGIDCELSEKDALIEELCEKEDSFSAKDKKKSDDKEAAEEIRKKAMERMAWKKKSNESAGGSAKKSRRSRGDAVEFLKEKLELHRKEQEVRARQQELQIELLRKQTEQQQQISQALMTMMQNLVKK